MSCSIKLKETQDKIKNTCLKRYNVENPAQNEEIKNKIKNTYLKRYGVTSLFLSETFRNKIKNILIEKFGVDCVLKLKSIRDKSKNTNLLKYGFTWPAKNKQIQKLKLIKLRKIRYPIFKDQLKKIKNIQLTSTLEDFISSSIFDFKCLSCGKKFKNSGTNYQDVSCSCRKYISKNEKEISNWLKLLGINVIENDRSVLDGQELDIYLEDYSLAIEYDGIYWHSELFKNRDYHLNKTRKCNEKGIQLIHIFENEWIEKKEIVKSVILAKLKKFERRIPARKCKLKELSNNQYKEFCLDNHIQGYVPAKYKIGLFYGNELVQICSFGKSRFKKDEIELLMHCSKLNTQIIGRFK